MSSDFKDAALVLVGHGSTLNAESGAPTWQHAETLRARGDFAQVLACFWKQEPFLSGVLRGVFARRVFIVPLFISDGYFTEEVIPRELGFCARGEKVSARVRQAGDQTLHYARPVGTHPSMTGVLLAKAASVIKQHPSDAPPHPRETALFIAGHGTGNNENSRKTIERQVELIRQRDLYAEVHPAFMEEEPLIEKCYAIARSAYMIMIPFFISDGLHSYEDIPVMLGEDPAVVKQRYRLGQPTWNNPTKRQEKTVWYSSSIGSEPCLVEVIMERVREMA